MPGSSSLPADAGMLIALAGVFAGSYLVGSLPFAYWLVRLLTGEDITTHGSGNVGAMNVRRTTGSWGWFVVAMTLDVSKGLLPVICAGALARAGALGASFGPASQWLPTLAAQAALAGAVVGHNYSLWLALSKRRLVRTGKGLATGAGALFAYDWRYFVVVIVVAVLAIALTRYLLAGQVAAAVSLPAAALVLESPDWPFALMMGLLVYLAHHRRFMGLLAGREPRLYVNDRMGPRG